MDSTIEFYPGEGLPFITLQEPANANQIDYFDFRNCGYERGLELGMQAAYRLMRANERGVLTTYTGEQDEQLDELYRSVIEAACEKLVNSKPLENDGNRGASIGFLESISKILAAAARMGSWRDALAEEVRVLQDYARETAREECNRLDKFAASMELGTLKVHRVSKRRKTAVVA